MLQTSATNVWRDKLYFYLKILCAHFNVNFFVFRLLLSSCGPSQWRLDGPGAWPGAEAQVSKTPMTNLMQYALMALAGLFFMFLCWCAIGFIILDDIFDWDIID